MFDLFFKGIFDSGIVDTISAGDFLLCIVVSLLSGILLANAYMYKSNYTKSFVTTVVLLPTVVCVVIMMVNGNVGTGVAVAGAFSLVRFRSVPGTAKEIIVLFLAMSVGLIAGMGYLGFAVLFAALMSFVYTLQNVVGFGVQKNRDRYKTIRITIPEDLNYTEIFDPIWKKYVSSFELVQVKTTNMGSMFHLTYQVAMLHPAHEKEMIDEIRCRNGNLEVNVSIQETIPGAL